MCVQKKRSCLVSCHQSKFKPPTTHMSQGHVGVMAQLGHVVKEKWWGGHRGPVLPLAHAAFAVTRGFHHPGSYALGDSTGSQRDTVAFLSFSILCLLFLLICPLPTFS